MRYGMQSTIWERNTAWRRTWPSRCAAWPQTCGSARWSMSLTGWYRTNCRNRFLLSGKPSLKGPLSSGTNECARVDSSRQAHEKAGVEGMVLYRKSSMKAVLFVIVGLVLGLTATAAAMTLRSSDIRPNGMIAKRFIFNSFGCTGENAQPSVAWSGVPTGAKALSLTGSDPDAPTTY